jgi:hypothetical protein
MSQSQKTLLTLVAAVLLAGGVGGYAYFGVFKGEEQAKKQQDHEMRLFAPQKLEEKAADGGAAPADFTRLSVTYGGETTQLEREPGKDWRIVSPARAKADKLVVDAIVSQLQSSKFKATLEENPDPATLEKYGLTKPKFVVEATALVNGERRSVKLTGGIENTFDGAVFVRRNDEKPVFTAEGGVRFTMARTTFDLREKQVLAFDEKRVKTVSVKTAINDYALEQRDKLWFLSRPVAEGADNTSISAMLAQVASEKAQAFFTDSPEARQRFGLDAPLIDAAVTFIEGAPARLRIGRVAADGGDAFYALREDDDGVVLAQVGNGATQLDRNPNDLRDKTILRFKKELVTKIVFRDGAGGEVIVAKDSVDASADAWRVVAPKAGKAKVFKVTSALWTLGATKALATGEEKPKDWKRYGIDDTSRAVILSGEGGTELGRLSIGKLVPGTPSAYWVRGTRDQVLQSDGSRFTELPFTLADVLDEPGTDAGP